MYDPVLTSTYKVFQSVNALERLTRLNDCLVTSNFMRNRAVSALQDLWRNAEEDLRLKVPFDVVYQNVKKELKGIKSGVKTDKNLWNVYKECLRNTPISKLYKDTFSLQTFFLQRTNKGQNGPTHLVSYTRKCNRDGQITVRSYVIKWTNWNEICSWRLYDLFAKNWIVPKAAALDFQKCIHEKPDLSCVKLNDRVANDLKQRFLGVVGQNIHPSDSQLMLMEKVKGANLIDFAQTKYPYLNMEEKHDLFRKMGQLAMLDLLYGNTDRLVQTNYDFKTEKYQLEDLTANLGNLMVHWVKDEGVPELYAIDNGMKLELVTDEKHKEAYNTFIQDQVVKRPAVIYTIFSSIQKSFGDVAEQLSEKSSKPLKDSLKNFECILGDLKTSHNLKAAMEKGFIETTNDFQKLLSHDTSLINDHHPALHEAMKERFQSFLLKGELTQFDYEALEHWLVAMETYAEDGSFESREAVLKLSRALPSCESLPQDVQESLRKIKTLAESGKWDPTISPNSKQVLKRFTRQPNTNCVKKLTF